MIEGAFKSLKHIHEFSSTWEGALMKDTLEWKSPFGFLSEIADKLFLENYLKKFLKERNSNLKKFAETNNF